MSVNEDIRVVCSTLRQKEGEIYIEKYYKDGSNVKLTETQLHQERLDEYGGSLEDGISYYVRADLTKSNTPISEFNELMRSWEAEYLD